MERTVDGTKSFFAAANSGYGFYSFYDEIFEESSICERYIIKGGPGTGKSRFMKEVAYKAQCKGMDVLTYSCSSDPSSLDGVIVDRGERGRLCILDGTAPHICEASIPGARDSILNFCEFWDSDVLRAEKDGIIELGLKKSKAYHSASDCLRSSLMIRREFSKNAMSATDREKLSAYVKKFVSSLDRSDTYFERIGLSGSFGMFGFYALGTYLKMAKSVIVIDNSYGNASLFLDCIFSFARAGRISTYRSYDFLDPHTLDAVCLADVGISFISSDLVSSDGEEKVTRHVSMQRFTDKSERNVQKQHRKKIEAVDREIIKKATYHMQGMHHAHFELEKIYSSSMDFSKKEAFTDDWIAKNL
jgi:hypothetical protein